MTFQLFDTVIYSNSCRELFYCFGVWINSVTEGRIWTLLLLGFVAVLYIGASRFGGARAAGFAGVGGLFGALFFVTLKLIPWWIGSLFIIGGGISFVILLMNER